jgi:hypothetical protein
LISHTGGTGSTAGLPASSKITRIAAKYRLVPAPGGTIINRGSINDNSQSTLYARIKGAPVRTAYIDTGVRAAR